MKKRAIHKPQKGKATDDSFEVSSRIENDDGEHFITENEFNILRMACRYDPDSARQIDMTERNGTLQTFNYVCRANHIKHSPSAARYDEQKIQQCLVKLMHAQERERKLSGTGLPPVKSTMSSSHLNENIIDTETEADPSKIEKTGLLQKFRNWVKSSRLAGEETGLGV